MSRYEESKLLEHDSRLAQMSRDLEHLKEDVGLLDIRRLLQEFF